MFLFVTGAQAINPQGNSDRTTQLSKLLPKDCSFAGQFQQRREISNLPIPLISNGLFFFQCEMGLIWQTTSPINETLIFTNQKKVFKLADDSTISQLKSRQYKGLSKILLNLMSGDTVYLQKQFTISSNATESVQLTPKRTFLKRAIKGITLSQASQNNSFIFTLQDKNKQVTEITSQQDHVFDKLSMTRNNCLSVIEFNTGACDYLVTPSLAAENKP